MVAYSQNPDYQYSVEKNIWVLEKEIAANVWSQKRKEPRHSKNIAFQTLETGVYRVSLVERNGNAPLKVVFRSGKILIGECSNKAIANLDVLIYPNPASTTVVANLKDAEKTTLRFFHATGTESMSILVESAYQNIDLTGLKNGIYYIYAETKGRRALVDKLSVINE